MTIKFVRRAAAEILRRGESAVRIKPSAMQDAEKALTKDDVRNMISGGTVYALKAKHNVSMNSKIMRKKRAEGRRRGRGRRKGTSKARSGRSWEKKVRSQRFLLNEIRGLGKIDTKLFRKYYLLVKGNIFADKTSLLLHLSDDGVKLTEAELKGISEKAKAMYK